MIGDILDILDLPDGAALGTASAADDLALWYFHDQPLPNRFAAAIQILRTGAAFAGAGARFVCLSGRLAGTEAAAFADYGLAPAEALMLRPFFPARAGPARLRAWRVRRALRRLAAEIGELPGRHVLMCRGGEGVGILPALGPLARAAGLPLVHEMHCLDHLRQAERRAGRSLTPAELPGPARAARDRERAAVRQAGAFVFLTPEVEAAARAELGIVGPGLVLPSGAELPALDGPVPAPRWDLVYAGKLETRKGVRTLCAAMRHLPGRRLAIAGGPEPAAAELRAWLAAEGLADRVEVVGVLAPAEAPAFLRSGRIGTCPLTVGVDSVADRFTSPLKLLQMMGLGMAVVAADVAPVRAVATDGADALLARPDDPAAFAAAAERLLADPALAARLGAAARRTAARWSWEARAASLRAFLAALAPAPRPAP